MADDERLCVKTASLEDIGHEFEGMRNPFNTFTVINILSSLDNHELIVVDSSHVLI